MIPLQEVFPELQGGKRGGIEEIFPELRPSALPPDYAQYMSQPAGVQAPVVMGASDPRLQAGARSPTGAEMVDYGTLLGRESLQNTVGATGKWIDDVAATLHNVYLGTARQIDSIARQNFGFDPGLAPVVGGAIGETPPSLGIQERLPDPQQPNLQEAAKVVEAYEPAIGFARKMKNVAEHVFTFMKGGQGAVVQKTAQRVGGMLPGAVPAVRQAAGGAAGFGAESLMRTGDPVEAGKAAVAGAALTAYSAASQHIEQQFLAAGISPRAAAGLAKAIEGIGVTPALDTQYIPKLISNIARGRDLQERLRIALESGDTAQAEALNREAKEIGAEWEDLLAQAGGNVAAMGAIGAMTPKPGAPKEAKEVPRETKVQEGALPTEAKPAIESVRPAAAEPVAEAPKPALVRTGEPQGVPSAVVRYEEPGAAPSGVDKPHGLYTTPEGVESPHADLGGAKRVLRVAPEARVLSIEPYGQEVVMRKGAVGAGAGVHSARRFLGAEEFARLRSLSKSDLIAEAEKIDSSVDWSRYYDTQEIMEGIGGVLARKGGYDAIWLPDRKPEFSEFVGLTEKAFGEASAPPPPTPPAPPAQTAPPPPPPPRPIETEPNLGRRISRWTSFLPSRMAPWLGKHGGEPGKAIEAGVTEASKRQLSEVGVDMQAAREVLKGVDRATAEEAMRLLNERRTAEEAGPKAAELAEKMRTVLDRALKAGQEIGVERKVGDKWVPVEGSGRAFPEVLNERGQKALQDAMRSKASRSRARIIEHMLKTGQAKTEAEAHAKLEAQYGAQARGVLSHYLTKTRVQLPEDLIEWNPKKVMKAHLQSVWNYVEGARQFGTRYEKMGALVNQLRDVLPEGYAESTKTALEAMYGAHPAEPWGATVARTFTNYQRMRTLGGSIAGWLRNTNQWIPGNAILTYGDLLKTWAKLPPFARLWKKSARELGDLVERRSGVSGITEFTEGDTRNPVVKAAMKVYSAADPSNQIRTAVASWQRMETGLKTLIEAEQKAKGDNRMLTWVRGILSPLVDPQVDLPVDLPGMRGDPTVVRRVLGKMGLKASDIDAATKSGQWSEKDYQNAAFRMSTDTQFMLSNASKRFWHHNDWLKALFLYKGFGIDQVRLFREHAVGEFMKGNLAPMKRWVLGTLAVGEVYNLLRDWLRDDEKSLTNYFTGEEKLSLRGVANRAMNDALQGGLLGMIADMTMGIGDWVVGPAGSTLRNVKALGEAAIEGVARGGSSPAQMGAEALKTIGDFASKELSGPGQVAAIVSKAAQASEVPGLADALGRDPRLVQANLWRRRAQDVAGVEENPGVGGMVKDAIGRMWTGKDKWRIEHNTMLYRYAVENIDKGEIDDAVYWIRYAVRAARDDPEKRRTLVAALKAGIEADAPLGPKKHWEAMFAKWPREEVDEAMQLQGEWLRDAKTAIGKAIDEEMK